MRMSNISYFLLTFAWQPPSWTSCFLETLPDVTGFHRGIQAGPFPVTFAEKRGAQVRGKIESSGKL